MCTAIGTRLQHAGGTLVGWFGSFAIDHGAFVTVSSLPRATPLPEDALITDATSPVSKRIAQCTCGALQAETTGEPIAVATCSCRACQRRTGSAFGISAFWSLEDVKMKGDVTRFVRSADSGGRVVFYFCPTCGSTIFWKMPDLRSSWLGIAGGAFADPHFPPPTISLWEQFKHDWVCLPASQHFIRQPD